MRGTGRGRSDTSRLCASKGKTCRYHLGGCYAPYVARVDEEDEAARALDQQDGQGPEVPPLCPQHRQGDVFWTDDDQACPLCERRGRSGSWVICAACAEEAGVCV